MSNKHFCQGPSCHEKITQDRFLKSRGVVRGRYALWTRDTSNEYHSRCKYFCSTACENEWLNKNMECVRARTVVPFINHRRESQGYQKVTTEHEGWRGTYNSNSIERVDNRTEVD